MAERPTFSPMWHRVRAMRPRLRPHVQITRQHYRGQRWHVVHDPTANQFFRLTPIAHEFVALLDGKRTVEEVWESSLQLHGDDAPTQPEIVELMSQLYNSNLLSADAAPETEQLLRRGRERTKRRIQQQAIGIMYLKARVFNPDRIISAVEPLLRPLLNIWGFLLWAAFLVVTLFALAPHWDALKAGFSDAVAPANWAWLIAVFIVTKAIHELGHGVICKRHGGQVPEFGFMLLVFFPSPYVDVSSCWGFASKWKRIAVGAGGMLFELAIAAGASWAWMNTDPGTLVHKLAFNTMVTASVTTILFNANPLMRFDGYYILSDLIETPNLMQRSTRHLCYLFQRHVYRIEQARPAATEPSERFILITYGLAALAYRVFLFFSITLYIMGLFFGVGLVLAVWTAAAWFLLPLGKFVHWLSTSPQHAEHRVRGWAVSIAMALVVIVGLGAVPAPDHRRASGVVESAQRSGVFAAADGFIDEARVAPGDAVSAGDVIVVGRSPELEANLALVDATLLEIQSVERDVMVKSPVATEIARDQMRILLERRAFLQQQIDRLVIVAPHAGVIVGADPRGLVGSFTKRGEPICEIVDTSRIRVAATLATEQAAPLLELGPDRFQTRLRLRSRITEELSAGEISIVEAAGRELPHAALGFSGGGTIQTSPEDRSGRMARTPQFIMHVEPPVGEGGQAQGAGAKGWSALPGERIEVRFTLPSRPLLSQWADRFLRLVQGRVNI